MMPLVIAFSGRIGSGKSSISTAVASRLQVPWASFGAYVRHVAAFLGLDSEKREVLQDVGGFLVQYPQAFCRKVLEKASYVGGDPLVVDGIRHREIVDELRLQVAPAELVLVYVEVDEATIERRRKEDHRDGSNLPGLEQHSTEEQVVSTLPQLADMTILNDETRPIDAVADEVLDALIQIMRQRADAKHAVAHPGTPWTTRADDLADR